MNSNRPNTVVVDFGVLPARPDAEKVHKFLMNDMELKLSEVKQIQFHHIRKCVFIQMTSFEAACHYETEHNLKHNFWYNDKKFAIHIYVDSELATVRVHDLPPSVDNKTVHKFMQQYGTVTSITNERWKYYFPGVFNGVRVLHIRLRQPIPSYVTINGFQSYCSYDGQKPTCRICGQTAHPQQKCSNSTPASSNKSTSTPPTASILQPSDFPPLCNEQSPSSPDTFGKIIARARRSLAEEESKTQDNKNNDSSDEDSSLSSSASIDTNENIGHTKRRLPTRKAKEKKKVCQEQCPSNACPSDEIVNLGNENNGKRPSDKHC